MKFRSLKQKLEFLDQLEKEDNFTVMKKLPGILRLSTDKNWEVRSELAQQLVLFDRAETEEILYKLLSDQNRMVRLEAIDSFSVCHMPEAVDKILSMIAGEGYLIRAFGVHTLFQLMINIYGFNREAVEKYRECIKNLFKNEKNKNVLAEYYENQYCAGDIVGLYRLEETYKSAVDENESGLIWAILHIFQGIRNRKNEKKINEILAYQQEKLPNAQIELVKKIVSETSKYKLMILDKDNTYISHVISMVLEHRLKKEIFIDTAGLGIEEVEQENITAFCVRNHITENHTCMAKRLISAHEYDKMICINVENAKERFSLGNVSSFFVNDTIPEDKEIFSIVDGIIKILE